jgi:hypothetical protein
MLSKTLLRTINAKLISCKKARDKDREVSAFVKMSDPLYRFQNGGWNDFEH